MAESSEPDWYLKQWAVRLGKTQADLARTYGWTKNSGHKIWHSKQPYSRKQVNQVAAWLGIEPYELLMPPDQALALRRFRESAAAIVAEERAAFEREK